MRIVFPLLFLFLCKFTTAQVNFSTIRFDKALKKAQSEQKLIFLQFESANCMQCNDVANKGLENKEVASKINQQFFCLKVDAQHPDRDKIARAYNLDASNAFGTLFIDHDGTIVHKFQRTTSFGAEYLNQVEIALTKAGDGEKISELEKEYKKGNRSLALLQALLRKRQLLNLVADSLLEEYVELLPVDSLQSIQTLGFIAQQAPLLDSKAYKALTKDSLAFQRAWYSMNLPKRIEVNNQIINKSMAKAIREKNEAFAHRTAYFALQTNSSDRIAGDKAYSRSMLRFYDEINDTTNYFNSAVSYYDRYYFSVSVDSIKRIDTLTVRGMAKSSATKDTAVVGGNKRIISQVAYRPITQDYSNALNKGAYQFYAKTNDFKLLSIATAWAEKALQFYTTPEVLSTYARLLYKQKQAAKAIEIMSEAIALQQKNGYPTKDYDQVLEAMKKKNPLQN